MITLAQFAGVKFAALPLLLPAATTTTVPAATAALIAFWVVESQAPLPPRLMLTTRSGVGLLLGIPLTVNPADQRIASAMSLV